MLLVQSPPQLDSLTFFPALSKYPNSPPKNHPIRIHHPKEPLQQPQKMPSSTTSPTPPVPPARMEPPTASTSVFKALGSYADRTKDSQNSVKSPSSQNQSLGSLPNGIPSTSNAGTVAGSSTHATTSLSATASSSSVPSPNKAQAKLPSMTSTSTNGGNGKAASAEQEKKPTVEDDGPWETVQTGRNKSRQHHGHGHSHGHGHGHSSHQQQNQRVREESHDTRNSRGSNSKDWRERPGPRTDESNQKEKEKDKEKDRSSSQPNTSHGKSGNAGVEDERSLKSVKEGKKPLTSGTMTTSSPQTSGIASPSPKPISNTLKNPWNIVAAVPAASLSNASTTAAPSQQRHTTPPNNSNSNLPTNITQSIIQTPKVNTAVSNQFTPSPSVGNTTTEASTTVASPNLSSIEGASTSTAHTSSIATKDDIEETGDEISAPSGSTTMPVTVPAPTPAPTRKAAPPPTVNAWDLRKKAQSAPSISSISASTSTTKNTTSSKATDTSRGTQSNGVPAPLQFGSVSPQKASDPLPSNNNVEGIKVNKKHSVKERIHPSTFQNTTQVDQNAFPDLAQAAEIVQATSHGHGRERKESEDSSTALLDDVSITTPSTTAGSKKPKWMAIPATELLAAADEAAEASRRQARDAAAATKRKTAASVSGGSRRGGGGAGGESSSMSPVKAGQPGDSSMESTSSPQNQGRLPRGRPGRSGSASTEIRLPPHPSNGSTSGARRSSSGFKPVFGTVRPGSNDDDAVEGDTSSEAVKHSNTTPPSHAHTHGGYSAPLSRQTSRQSRRSSIAAGVVASNALKAKTSTSSPTNPNIPLEGGIGLKPSTSFPPPTSNKFGGGAQTAPIPQNPFANNPNNLPRPPRRDGRGSFSANGRGGGPGRFRKGGPGGTGGNGHHMYLNGGNPTGGVWATDDSGIGYSHGQVQGQGQGAQNIYQRGFGMGYQVPPSPAGVAGVAGVTALPGNNGAGSGGAVDPLIPVSPNGLGMYSQRPPPPMPQTVVTNLDPLRFYVLGQVEYYFSMQNLAMDFFLRQQMDSEGWIDIPMIASFNRIKSLTPEVPIVKEVMLLSSLLEVRDDKVRLGRGEAKRWVLPDAKTSVYPPDPVDISSPNQNQNPNPTSPIAIASLPSLPSITGTANSGGGIQPENGIPTETYQPAYYGDGYQYPEGFESSMAGIGIGNGLSWEESMMNMGLSYGGLGMSMSPNGIAGAGGYIPGGVEGALMKSSVSGATTSGTSTVDDAEEESVGVETGTEGDESKGGIKGVGLLKEMNTPGTSMSGDGGEEKEVEL